VLVLKGEIFIMTGHYCEVSAYAGYKANERPLYFTIDDQRLEFRDIISKWAEPEKDFFKVVEDDGRVYTLAGAGNRICGSLKTFRKDGNFIKRNAFKFFSSLNCTHKMLIHPTISF
jgi:hypothetical protein